MLQERQRLDLLDLTGDGYHFNLNLYPYYGGPDLRGVYTIRRTAIPEEFRALTKASKKVAKAEIDQVFGEISDKLLERFPEGHSQHEGIKANLKEIKEKIDKLGPARPIVEISPATDYNP